MEMLQSIPPTVWVAGFVALGLVFWALSSWMESSTGLSSGAEVVASDTGQNRVKQLRDPETGLVGQPDYILRERVWLRKKLVPVEVKPTRRGDELHHSDEMQATVYMLLMRKHYGSGFAGYAYVKYKDHTFRVDLTRQRERQCLEYVRQIQEARRAMDVDRNHDQPGRCAVCAYRALCDQSLVASRTG